jgi:hypothetical protein
MRGNVHEHSPNRADHIPFAKESAMTALRFSKKTVLWTAGVLIAGSGFAFFVLPWLKARVSGRSDGAFAQLLIVKKRGAADVGADRQNFVEDYLVTQIAVLKSPPILEDAIRKGDLTKLKSLENVIDPAAHIQAGLSVNREARDDGVRSNLLQLTYRGSDPDDCAKILGAVVDSDQKWLDLTYKIVSDDALELIMKARDTLKKDLSEARSEYQKFRLEREMVGLSDVAANRLTALEARLTELMIREADARAKLEHAVAHSGDLNVVLDAREWGAKVGFDALPDDVRKNKTLLEAYAIHVKDAVESANAAKAALAMLIERQKAEVRALSSDELKDAELRDRVNRSQDLYNKTVERLAALSLARDSGGFEAKLLSITKSPSAR